MEAMVLAAGAGTRLRPITDHTPKALVEVNGRPIIAHVLDRLAQAGVTRAVVNTHHHEDQIREFVRNNTPSEMEIVLSPEPNGPYDTGGGLFAAAPLFEEDKPFLLHNVDVLSTIPLRDLIEAHHAESTGADKAPVATLAVTTEQPQRRLLFDDAGLLGWENTGSDRADVGNRRVRKSAGPVRSLAFTGIHVVDPRIFSLSNRTGTFSIITLYLELAQAGHRISPFYVSEYRWIDIGTRERLEEAEQNAW